MIAVTVNGEQRRFPEGTSVQALLARIGAPAGGRGIAVALDEQVVPRGEWDSTMLGDGDRVEILVAVQGG